MTKYKVLFVGAINEYKSPLGGEEYKNQLIISKLKLEMIDLIYVDTIFWKKSPSTILYLFYNLLFIKFDSILISASSVSTYRLLKLIYYFKPKLLSKVTYLVIGGYLPEALESGIFKLKFYRRLRSLIVEGFSLKNRIDILLSSTPIHVIPNFKYFPSIDLVKFNTKQGVSFVYIGRICIDKGVKVIFEAIKKLNSDFPDLKFQVDFYGPIEDNLNFNDLYNYRGYLNISENPAESYSLLSSYDCLLFPTFWKGEGFPGVLIDAFISGLPIIATNWNMNNELIKHDINGFLIDIQNVDMLADKMKWIILNKEDAKLIGIYNQHLANNYHIDNVWPNIFSLIV